MPLDKLPESLQHQMMLEWMSPEAVFVLAQASDALRRIVLSSPVPFRAAEGEILSDACVDWFRERNASRILVLWSSVEENFTSFGLYLFKEFKVNGKLHRDDDLPAIEGPDGTQFWYQNGQIHRDGDQPAVVYSSGAQKWYHNGKLHRDGDLPAAEWPSGMREYWQHGELQSRIRDDGAQMWYKLCGPHRDLPTWADAFPEWHRRARLHRDGDLPAAIQADGTLEWYQNGDRHRDGDQPAEIRLDGTKKWYQNGQLHRDGDRPAVVAADGERQWWQHGELSRDGVLAPIQGPSKAWRRRAQKKHAASAAM